MSSEAGLDSIAHWAQTLFLISTSDQDARLHSVSFDSSSSALAPGQYTSLAITSRENFSRSDLYSGLPVIGSVAKVRFVMALAM